MANITITSCSRGDQSYRHPVLDDAKKFVGGLLDKGKRELRRHKTEIPKFNTPQRTLNSNRKVSKQFY